MNCLHFNEMSRIFRLILVILLLYKYMSSKVKVQEISQLDFGLNMKSHHHRSDSIQGTNYIATHI